MAKTPSKPPAIADDDAAAARAAYLAERERPPAPPVRLEVVRDSMLSPWRGSSKVVRVLLPAPRIGGKAWLLNRKGIFVLEEGPGVLRTIACTHIGSGSMIVSNGLPNDNGEFPLRQSFTPGSEEEYNGRPLFRANPVVMGSWMMDAGFSYGLTIQAEGGMDNNCAIATIVWLPAPAPRVTQQ